MQYFNSIIPLLFLLGHCNAGPVIFHPDPIWHLEAVQNSTQPLERRVNGACSRYPTAFKSLQACATGSQFCSNYLGHGPSTITRTITTKTTPPQSTLTSFTKTETVTNFVTTPNVIAGPTVTSTQTITDSVDVVTITSGATTETTYLSTFTPMQCVTVAPPARFARRDPVPEPEIEAVHIAAAKAGVSCGLRTFPSETISGACDCYNSVVQTTVTTAAAARTTTIFIDSTTSITQTTGSDTTSTSTESTSVTTTLASTTVPATVVETQAVTTAAPVSRFQLVAFNSGCGGFDGLYANGGVLGDGSLIFNWGYNAGDEPIFFLDCMGQLRIDQGPGNTPLIAFVNQPYYGDVYFLFNLPSAVPADSYIPNGCSVDPNTLEFTCSNMGQYGYFFTCCSTWRFAQSVRGGCSQFQMTAQYVD